jgi:hypothetical protein
MPKLERTKPCAGCPWLRRSVLPDGYLGADNPLHFYRASVAQEQHMPCHEAIDYEDPDWLTTQFPDAPYCAGTLIFFRNFLKVPRDPVLAAAVRSVNQLRFVFTNPEGFMRRHLRGLFGAIWPYAEDGEDEEFLNKIARREGAHDLGPDQLP